MVVLVRLLLLFYLLAILHFEEGTYWIKHL
jgi:hypothetical protein